MESVVSIIQQIFIYVFWGLRRDLVFQMGKLRPGRGRDLPRGRPGTRTPVSVLNSALNGLFPEPVLALRGWLQEMGRRLLLSRGAGQRCWKARGEHLSLVSFYYVPVLSEALKGRHYYPHFVDVETEVPSDEVTCPRLFGKYLLCTRLLCQISPSLTWSQSNAVKS